MLVERYVPPARSEPVNVFPQAFDYFRIVILPAIFEATRGGTGAFFGVGVHDVGRIVERIIKIGFSHFIEHVSDLARPASLYGFALIDNVARNKQVLASLHADHVKAAVLETAFGARIEETVSLPFACGSRHPIVDDFLAAIMVQL